jgi:hypothetical protein
MGTALKETTPTMPPSPPTAPWVLEIEDPASVRPELLRPLGSRSPGQGHAALAVPLTPAGGRRACSLTFRVRADRAREWARLPTRDSVESPRHRGRPADVNWALLARRTLRPEARPWDRVTIAVVSTCTVIGVWLGALAPPSSPVSAPSAAGALHSVP